MERASPQLENGHTRIANELLEAIIKCSFNGTEFRLIFAVIRKTYGWKRKKTVITYGVLAQDLEIDIRNIKRTVNKLIQIGVILKEKCGKQNILGLNKDYKSWRLWKTEDAGGEETTAIVAK